MAEIGSLSLLDALIEVEFATSTHISKHGSGTELLRLRLNSIGFNAETISGNLKCKRSARCQSDGGEFEQVRRR
jgi:hypothetical protein